MRKGIIAGGFILVGIVALIIFSSVSDSKEKKAIVEKFYSSYKMKDINIYNESVVDELKEKNKEEVQRRKTIYEDILKFEVNEIKEIKNRSLEFNGKKYDKKNIATFEIFYEVDFKENLTSSSEGKNSTIKILTREDKNSPWFISGQDGHGL